MNKKLSKHKNSDKKNIISIVTVTYNSVHNIEETILSVINQTYQNIEYIIIDGGSVDGTMNIVKKYKNSIDYIVSEKDNGIYDAMNKGIKLASGKWINFLNSGDTFNNKKVIESISFKNYENYVMIFGNAKIYNAKKIFLKTLKALNLTKNNLILFGTRVVCHQAIFYNKKIKFKYPKKYRLKGELYSYFEYLKHGKSAHLNLVLCNYNLGGIGNILQKKNDKELWEVLKDQVGLMRFLYIPYYIFTKILFLLKKA
jgi:glycosyltransferase involved in cell wall biosynthesis